MSKAVTAAIYVRVSRRDQKLENQLPALQKMAAARKLKVVEIYEDKMSGMKEKRPGLMRLKKDAHEGKFDVVLVWAIDRLGRSMMGTMNAVLEFDRLGVEVVSFQEPWLDMRGPIRQLMIAIFTWAAEQEHARITARTIEGLETARAEGKILGRPAAEIDMNELLRMRKEGLSIKTIAEKMDLGVATIHKALQSDDVPESARKRQKKPVTADVSTGLRPRVRVAS